MKKYETNKAKKLLIASIAIPIAVSALPGEMVSANTEIPTLHVYELNGSPKLEWATEILQENILTKTSFESGQEIPNLLVNGYDGFQEITNKEGYNSLNSLKIGKTTPNVGNFVYDLATESDQSEARFDNYRYVKNGSYISLTVKVKTDSKAVISPLGNGGRADKQITFQEYFNTNKEFKFTQPVIAGQKHLYISNAKEFKELISDKDYLNIDYNQVQFAENAYYTVRGKSTNGDYFYSLITDVDELTGKVTLQSPVTESFSVGEDFLMHRHINPLLFIKRTIENTNGEWVTLSFNAFVDGDKYNYNTELRGLGLRFRTLSEGNTYIDDVTFGYATEVEVFRENKSIYKGFLSDFYDNDLTVNPNKVNLIEGIIDENFNFNFNIKKPTNNTLKTSYQIQSIANNGNRGELSTPKEVEIKSVVNKYKYSIGGKESKTVTTELGLNENLSIPLKSINLETDYLHIQSIDENGNISEIESFKIADIIDFSNLEDIYDKAKELENSKDYNDFIDFIDELEQLYGDNLPQDLKDRLEELGKHHGVNTSFLLLEEGDFRLSTSNINSFGHTRLTAKKQTLTTVFNGDFSLIDARGTQEGWNVSVSATPFTVETFDGFVGSPHELPVGSLALNSVTTVEQVGQVHNSQLPEIMLNQLTAIDGQNTTVSLLNAAKNKGMGKFNFNFKTDALALTVDAVTAKIDTVNYPKQNTPYVSTITWDLVSGPQI